MTKVLNQLLYSSVVFGDELPGATLQLSSTSSGTKGPIQLVGTNFDFITGTQIGRLTHANTATRVYTLPDYSGQVLISGLFTAANQMLYSSAAGVYAMLTNTPGGALVTDITGAISWGTGAVGQVLTMVAGAPVFADLPDNGFINTSPLANQIAYYAAVGNALSPLTTVASRSLLTSALGVLTWSLITAPYLQASGGVPLGTGLANQILTAVGDGSFAWTNANPSVITPGNQFRLPYYSATTPGTVVSSSTFISTDETFRALSLLNHGSLRFYEVTVNGSNYLEFKAPLAFGPSVSWVLPATDGIPGALLQTDGFGNLTFAFIDHGTVNAGLINQIAYYAASGNKVSGLATTPSTVLGASSLGVPTWLLIQESYLSTTGNVALGAGTLNQVLVSDGATNFLWANAVDITGQVLSGIANYLAYYPLTGTKVDDTGFLSIDNSLNILNLLAGASLRIFPATGTNYLGFQSPPLAATTSWMLPAADGSSGYALSTDGAGNLSFIQVGRGVVHTGTALTLAYYQAATNEVYPWTNTPSRAALTTALNAITWGLITTEYLSGTGNVPLSVGTPNYALTPDGFGSFVWVDMVTVVGKVNTASANDLAFYAFSGDQVYGSLWLKNDESLQLLQLMSGGGLSIYNTSNTAYAALLAAPSLVSNVTWYLPPTDATLAGQALVSNALGQLSFTDLVDPGVQNAVATYQNATARRVSPSINFFNPVTGLLLKGATFIMSGDSVIPTVVTLKSGDNAGGAGANLYLAGGVGSTTAGSTVIGAGANNYLSIDAGGWVSVLGNASMRLYGTGATYVGFKAPTSVPSSLIWTLPAADGAVGQFLWTDGAGNLSWVTNRIHTGVLNAIPYYSSLNELSASALLIPVGLPLTDGNTLLVDKTTGQLSYAITVQPLATAGEIAVYTAPQTVGYYANLTWDNINKLIKVGSGGGLVIFEATNTYSTTITASPNLTASIALTLPPSLPAAGGYVLSGEMDGTLSFVPPSSDTRWEKRGVITLAPNATSVTIIYDTPYTQPPTWVTTQWVISEDGIYLPTYAVEKSTAEGFIVRFSTAIPATGTYGLNWQSYLTSVVSSATSLFIAGGVNGSGYLDLLQSMLVDNNTTITLAAILSSPRGYTCGGGSSVKGYIFGGSSPIPLPLGIITSYTYITAVLTDLGTTLITARSGAAGVGTRSKSYVAGGKNPGGASFSSIEGFNTSSETVSSLGSTLAAFSVSAGAATSVTKGAIVHSGLTSMEILTYATETLTPSAASFGATDISVGANDAANSKGYFGRDAGYVYLYDFILDTLTVLPNALNSISGLSSAGNSLDHAYFAGSLLMDSLDFSTGTVQTVAMLSGTGYLSASCSTFQSKGLL